MSLNEPQLYENHPQDSRVSGPLLVAPSVVAKYGTGGGNVPLIVCPISPSSTNLSLDLKDSKTAYAILAVMEPREPIAFQPGNLRRKAGADPSSDTFPTLKCDSGDQMPHIAYEDGGKVIAPTVTTCKGSRGGCSSEAIDELISIHKAQLAMNQDKKDNVASFKPGNSAAARSIGHSEETSPTLEAGGGGNNKPAVIAPSFGVDLFNQTLTGDIHVPLRTAGGHGAPAAATPTQAPTLTASNDPSRSPQSSEVTAQVEAVQKVTMQVRRLTPVECERLQGFPDNWTQISWKGKPVEDCPDGPRYKACGNSMATPCMKWIGERIDAVHKKYYDT